MTILARQPEGILKTEEPVGQKSALVGGGGRKALLIVLFLTAALPVIGPWIVIHQFGVNSPYMDQWSLIDVTLQSRQGGIPPALFLQHNEHRIVVPELLFIVLDNLTRWNQLAEMYTSLVIVCITSLGVYKLMESTLAHEISREKIIGIWFICNLLMFSLAQYENWLAAIGIENVLPMAFIIWAMVMLRSSMRARFRMVICLLLATGATFSSGNGFLAWPLVGLLWVWPPVVAPIKKTLALLVIWCAGFAANVAVYMHHYVHLQQGQGPVPLTAGSIFRYIVAFSGAPLAVVPWVDQATIGGWFQLLLLALAVGALCWSWWIKRDPVLSSNLMTWLAVAGIAVDSAAMAAPFRADTGVGQALSSRYYTCALYLPVALLNLVILIAAKWRDQKLAGQVAASLMAIIIFSQLLAMPPAIDNIRYNYKNRMQGKAALTLLRCLPDDDDALNTQVFPCVPYVRSLAETTNKLGFIHPPLIASNHAREIQLKVNPKRFGKLEQAFRGAPDNLLASGWAVFPNRGTPADAVFLTWDRFDDDPIIFALATIGDERSEVAKMLHKKDFAMCGWSANCPMSRLPKGAGPLRIRAWALNLQNGKAALIDGEGRIDP